MINYTTHLTADCAGAIFVNGNQAGILEKQSDVLTLVTDETSLCLGFYPIITEKAAKTPISYNAVIHSKGGTLYTNSDLITLTDYGKNIFKINFSPFYITGTTSLNAFTQTLDSKTFYLNNNVLTVNGESNNLYYILPCTISEPNVTKKGEFYLLSGKTENKKYSLLISKTLKVAFDAVSDEFEFDGAQINTLQIMNDIARHALVCIYKKSQTGFKKSEEYAVYTQDHTITPATPLALPWAFLEAVNLRNFDLARLYLHPTFGQSLKNEHIEAYFGDFIEATQDIFGDLNTIALVYDGNPRYVKRYKFELNGNYITNIDLVT